MKEVELSSIINQLNKLLLSCNTLLCNSEVMENAERIYGFHLREIPSDKYKSGFYYAVIYKDPDTNKWLPLKKSTDTDNKEFAKAFAIENKEAIIKEYKEHREKRQKKTNNKEFYQMLKDYYAPGSRYLQDDKVNNKRDISKKLRQNYYGFVNAYLIPYLRERKINSIQDINNSVYSDFKIYLQGKIKTTKTINNYLTPFNRILQHYERKELIPKLPYTKGTGIIKLSKEDKANAKQAALLPTDKLKNIFTDIYFDNKRDVLFSYLLAMIGLTTGMRDSEIGRIKREDIKHIKNENAYYVKAYNKKTESFNNETDEYRKLPLHPFIVEKLKIYIQATGKEKTDYLFGSKKIDKETGKTDGFLHDRKTHKAIVEFYRRIKIKEKMEETGNWKEAMSIEIAEIEKEMKEKHIIFYSLRHTFETLLGIKYKGQTLLIDYFMGHKPIQKMLANYLHTNEVDEKTFMNEYGKLLMDFQQQFIPAENIERHNAIKKYADEEWEENKHLLNENGKMNVDDAINIMKPLFIKKGNTNDNQDTDDFFESV